ncbi:hypothetical protein L0128_21815 [candidate division KSB1 bacterium]|nr:hypothetical protein [candidate division KSB1 bacterium]
MGKCPDCGEPAGPLSVITSWDKWGKFICPACGSKIRFSGWLAMVIVLMVLMFGAERLLHFMLLSNLALWISFMVSFITAAAIIIIVPVLWKVVADRQK